MMDQGMMGGGIMIWGMGLIRLLVVVVLLLFAAALAKYLFFRRPAGGARETSYSVTLAEPNGAEGIAP